jgi:outer membrane protein assembly factor BamB
VKLSALTSILVSSLCLGAAGAAEPWSTYRGNPQRTANTDGVAGPATPRVLWVLPSTEHFVAAPVPFGDRLFVSGLGNFNVPTFFCLDTDPKAARRVVWSKSTPYLKLPTVSSPAVSAGRLVFGDGMHQTDGAVLHCLRLGKGMPLWQLPVPGTLVHLEGAPTVAGGRVYLGGGAAGVLCVDLNRVTLDGKEMDVAAIRKLLDRKWSELLARYEEEKKKDPDFAVPPGEDQLPRPAPLRLWQQGKDRWHIDAPVAVAGDRVLAASAFLDKERAGDRALFCLDGKTGDVLWRKPLPFNPWGGPSVAGSLVVVSGSTIGYDPKRLKGAKGSVAAFDLADGKERWGKTVPGGVLSCAALTPDLVIATATDGKVRAFDLRTGGRRWIYDAGAPFFAPVAVAGGVAYAGDFKGVVHAIDIKDGAGKWKLDLGADPAVKAPGMIYAGPALQGGRLYVATCNLEGPHAGRPTAVVCVGEK